ncbi:MAG: DUF898 domain-containing protein [Ectothiorhodospiraceae bacterium]|nr:DUF898 domain-containing protein [Chromatiales bacterium]MCP5157316.1 DUF898 domain-containing protein [Ectothiorhodospiraceae bacterium]
MNADEPTGAAAPPNPADGPTVATPPSGVSVPAREVPVVFTGSGGEYFRVWIVNIALSLLTLGIYSAWAKVRNRRYFYGHTTVEGIAFDYTADPIAILKGRVIVVGALLTYSLTASVWPDVEPVMFVLALPLVPWVVNRAMAFNARYSAHRGLRFGFDGSYWPAFRALIGWPALGIATFGLLYPLAVQRRRRYLMGQHRFGSSQARCEPTVGPFYRAYAGASLIAVSGLALIVVASGGLDPFERPQDAFACSLAPVSSMVFYTLAGTAATLLTFITVTTYLQTRIGNHVWSRTALDGHRFVLAMQYRRMLAIQLTNALLIIATLGLAIPWAKVRTTRYRVQSMHLVVAGSLATFTAGPRARESALGQELGDAIDLDLGL